jgi:8-amino-7-oxononanoate synthase
MLPKKLQDKINGRIQDNSLRSLGLSKNLIDFSSNDYLGFSTSKIIFKNASEILKKHRLEINGATGSRLLTGNHSLYQETESDIASFHQAEAALIFTSGYDANIGFFGSIPQRGDIIFYDALCHASIRDGISMSHAKAYKFTHNDLGNLEKRLRQAQSDNNHPPERVDNRAKDQNIYIVTESVFSMDGDQPDLKALATLCKKNHAYLIIDEAHALGVLGNHGEGLVQALEIEDQVFARIVTFGKGLGCHGAAILGSKELKQYLVNFARSFIYTTGLPPHSIATVKAAYLALEKDTRLRKQLKSNISILQRCIVELALTFHFIPSHSAIHSCVVGGNSRTKDISEILQKAGFDVKPIVSPTVPKGQERLRICLHSYNTKEEIQDLLTLIKKNL